MTKNAEILDAMFAELATIGITAPTLDQQVAFLEGLRTAWLEDADENPMKAEYQRAVQQEINRLNLEIESE